MGERKKPLISGMSKYNNYWQKIIGGKRLPVLNYLHIPDLYKLSIINTQINKICQLFQTNPECSDIR